MRFCNSIFATGRGKFQQIRRDNKKLRNAFSESTISDYPPMHTRARKQPHACTQAYTRTHSPTYTNGCTHTPPPTHTHTDACTHTNTTMHTHTRSCTHTNTTHAHAHTHTRTHAHMYTLIFLTVVDHPVVDPAVPRDGEDRRRVGHVGELPRPPRPLSVPGERWGPVMCLRLTLFISHLHVAITVTMHCSEHFHLYFALISNNSFLKYIECRNMCTAVLYVRMRARMFQSADIIAHYYN